VEIEMADQTMDFLLLRFRRTDPREINAHYSPASVRREMMAELTVGTVVTNLEDSRSSTGKILSVKGEDFKAPYLDD
jgi:hypothetical protein